LNKKLFFINLIYYIALTSVGIVFVLGYFDILKNEWLSSFLIQIVICSALPILMYSLLVSKNLKKTFSDFGFKKLSKKLLLISIGIAITLYFLNIFVANSFHSILSLFGYETQLPALSISNKEILKNFFLTACLPGLCEEIIHRGMLLNGCKQNGYTRYGLLFSSILFGLMHLNISQFFYASILGFCMGISVLATESIWTGVICHFTNNFLSVYFSFDKNLPFQDFYNLILSKLLNINPFVLIIVLSLIIVALIRLFRYLLVSAKKQKLNEKSQEISNEFSNSLEQIDEETERFLVDINQRLENLRKEQTAITDKRKTSFCENIFLYSSLFMGAVITAISFIAGIL